MTIETRFSIGDVVYIGSPLKPLRRTVSHIKAEAYLPAFPCDDSRETKTRTLYRVSTETMEEGAWHEASGLRTKAQAQEDFRRAAFDTFMETFEDRLGPADALVTDEIPC